MEAAGKFPAWLKGLSGVVHREYIVRDAPEDSGIQVIWVKWNEEDPRYARYVETMGEIDVPFDQWFVVPDDIRLVCARGEMQ